MNRPVLDVATAAPVGAEPDGRPGPVIDRLISIREIAKFFELGRTAAYELTHRRDFPAPVVISARCYRWPEREVAAFAEALRQDPGQRRSASERRRGQGFARGGAAAAGRISGTVRQARGRGRAAR